MKQLKIVLIVVMSVIMVSLCAVVGVGVFMDIGTWDYFGIHVGGGFHAGGIDVGRIEVEELSIEDFDAGTIGAGGGEAGTVGSGDGDTEAVGAGGGETGAVGTEDGDTEAVGTEDGGAGTAGAGSGGSGSQGADTYFTWNSNYAMVLEKEIPAEDIRSLKIDYSMTFNDVIFYQGTGESILVREYMNFTPEEKQLSTVRLSGAELEVKGARRNFFSFLSIGSRDAYTEVFIPASVAGNLDDFSVRTVSGSVLSQILFSPSGDFAVTTTSGDVFFPGVRAGAIQASSTSGEIRLAYALTEKLSVSTTSGDIMVDQAKGKARFSSTSGAVRLGALEGELQVSTTSGDISLGQIEGDMTVDTTSGAVRLQKGQGYLDAGSTSGDIRADSLDGGFQLNTTSGTLSISEGSGFGKASSVSGDIRIFLGNLCGNLDISTTSGAVSLQIPETASFSFHFDSTSGDCRTFFDEALSFNKRGNQAEGQYGGGEHSLEISTVSGDLAVTQY